MGLYSEQIKNLEVADGDVPVVQPKDYSSSSKIITVNKKFKEVLALAERVAPLSTPVLLIGESGSGKELLSRYIHEKGKTKQGPFVGVNCASVPKDLMESEFFGFEAGSFTGASTSREGFFESAHKGTLFLDEVGEMPLSLQVKLLRAIQEGEIRRLGGSAAIPLTVRIISATNRDLELDVEKKLFREDLFYRIGVFILKIPPLRERKEDIPLLAKHFCQSFAKEQKREVPELTEAAIKQLVKYTWHGNVRELENVIERALIFCDTVISPEHLQFTGSAGEESEALCSRTLAEISQIAQQNAESAAILQALTLTAGNRVKAAQILDVSYKTLLNKIKLYKLSF